MAILKDLLVQSDARVVGVTRSASFEGDGLLAATSGNRSTSYVWNTNGTYTNLGGYYDDRYVNVTGDTMTGQLYINLDQDVGLNQNGSLIIGNKTGENLAFDGNEIMARNNSTASTLYLQAEGGNLYSSASTNYFSSKVGIGTTSPTEKLQVSGNTKTQHMYPQATDTYSVGSSSLTWANVYTQYVKSDTTLYLDSSSDTSIILRPNGSEMMRVKSAGVVIGVSDAPSSKLHLKGQQYIEQASNSLLGIDTTTYKIGHTRRDLHIKVASGSGSGVNDGYAAGITWGKGISTIYAGIYVQSSGNYGTRMIFGTTNSYSAGAYGRMIINPNGYVGIGTMSPSYPLHVVGKTYTSDKFISTGLIHSDTSLTGTSPYRFWTTNGSYTTLGLSGSTAIGSTTQPIYWNGSNFVTASTYPFIYGTGSNSVKLNLGSITSSGDRSFAFGGGVEATNTYSFAFGGYLYSSAVGSVAFGQGGIASGQFSFVRGGNWWIGIKLTGAANATTYTINDETSDKNFLHWLYNQLGQTAFNSLITKTRLLNNSTGQIFTITASNITKSGNSLTGSITTNVTLSTSALTNYEVYILSQIADGKASVSDGNGTLALGRSSHAEGEQVIAQNQAEHAQGMNNYSRKATTTFGNSGNTHFSVGIGPDGFNAKNAIEIMQNGDFYLYGTGNYNGTNSTGSGVSTLQSLLTTLINRKYWANVELTSSADTTKEPTFKTATVQNDNTHKCKMLYDSTEECMKFTFA